MKRSDCRKRDSKLFYFRPTMRLTVLKDSSRARSLAAEHFTPRRALFHYIRSGYLLRSLCFHGTTLRY